MGTKHGVCYPSAGEQFLCKVTWKISRYVFGKHLETKITTQSVALWMMLAVYSATIIIFVALSTSTVHLQPSNWQKIEFHNIVERLGKCSHSSGILQDSGVTILLLELFHHFRSSKTTVYEAAKRYEQFQIRHVFYRDPCLWFWNRLLIITPQGAMQSKQFCRHKNKRYQ